MNSIKRTAEVLKLLSEEPLRFTDIVRELKLTKSTAHRLLESLEQTDLIKKNPLTNRFHLGPLIAQVAASPINEHQHLITCCIEEIRRLRDRSGETANLQISMGTERMCLEEVLSTESIKYVSGKGSIYPIFVGSAGKMLLSMMRDKVITILMRKFSTVPTAPNPIKDTDALWKEIHLARRLGHSTSFGERIAGSASVAVPISGYVCPAVLNIMGPADRFTQDVIETMVDEMKSSASKITQDIAQIH